MTKSIESLADILAPVTPEAFFADIRYQKPLHIKGDPEKFARVMSWPTLTELVNPTSIWSAQPLKLMLDHRRIEPPEYCVPELGREKPQVLMRAPGKGKSWLRQTQTRSGGGSCRGREAEARVSWGRA